jgi:TonB family protein
VVVVVRIDERGAVTGAAWLGEDERLGAAAEEAARKWVFRPMAKDGVARKVQSFLAFEFSGSDLRTSAEGPGGVFTGAPGTTIAFENGAPVPGLPQGMTFDPSRSLTTQRIAGGVLADSAKRRVPPNYPREVREGRVEGDVGVEIVVSEAGIVETARAVSGHKVLQEPAVEAAKQWTFAPTLVGGVPTKVVGTLTFSFRYNADDRTFPEQGRRPGRP